MSLFQRPNLHENIIQCMYQYLARQKGSYEATWMESKTLRVKSAKCLKTLHYLKTWTILSSFIYFAQYMHDLSEGERIFNK